MLFYISGKITGTDDYLERFAEAEELIKASGHTAINPAKMHSEWAEGVDYDSIMDLCFKELDIAEGIWLLPDWRDSKGACMEYGYARALDKMVVEHKYVRASVCKGGE